MIEVNTYEVAWNGDVLETWPTFAQAEDRARELEADYDSLFVADEYRDESSGHLTLTIRSEQRGFGTRITVRRVQKVIP